jgi:hypothetical protein
MKKLIVLLRDFEFDTRLKELVFLALAYGFAIGLVVLLHPDDECRPTAGMDMTCEHRTQAERDAEADRLIHDVHSAFAETLAAGVAIGRFILLHA